MRCFSCEVVSTLLLMHVALDTYTSLIEGFVAECVVDLICPGALYPSKNLFIWDILDLG